MESKSNSNVPSTSTAGSIISFKFNKTPLCNTDQKQKIADNQHRQQSDISEYRGTKEGFPCFTCRTWFLTKFNRDSHCTLVSHKLKESKLQAELDKVIENLSRADFSQSEKTKEISLSCTEVPEVVKDKAHKVPNKEEVFSIRNNKDLKDFLENFEITKSCDISFILHVVRRITTALTEYQDNHSERISGTVHSTDEGSNDVSNTEQLSEDLSRDNPGNFVTSTLSRKRTISSRESNIMKKYKADDLKKSPDREQDSASSASRNSRRKLQDDENIVSSELPSFEHIIISYFFGNRCNLEIEEVVSTLSKMNASQGIDVDAVIRRLQETGRLKTLTGTTSNYSY